MSGIRDVKHERRDAVISVDAARRSATIHVKASVFVSYLFTKCTVSVRTQRLDPVDDGDDGSR